MLLWIGENRPLIGFKAALTDFAAGVVVSAASVWEIEIKRATGRLDAPADLSEMVDAAGFERLPISFEHARAAGRLPPHHGDPFDRVLIAQAQLEGLTLATADRAIEAYAVVTLSVQPD